MTKTELTHKKWRLPLRPSPQPGATAAAARSAAAYWPRSTLLPNCDCTSAICRAAA